MIDTAPPMRGGEYLRADVLEALWRTMDRALDVELSGSQLPLQDFLTPDQRIFLITHTYVPGWQLPGGGVESGETVVEALARELVEEGNIEILEPPVLRGMFFNSRVSNRDHVAVFVVRSFRQACVPVPDREIAAHGFFSLDALPENTTSGARARIAEVMLGAP